MLMTPPFMNLHPLLLKRVTSIPVSSGCRGVNPVATLGAQFQSLDESKDQKTLKIATIACLSLLAL